MSCATEIQLQMAVQVQTSEEAAAGSNTVAGADRPPAASRDQSPAWPQARTLGGCAQHGNALACDLQAVSEARRLRVCDVGPVVVRGLEVLPALLGLLLELQPHQHRQQHRKGQLEEAVTRLRCPARADIIWHSDLRPTDEGLGCELLLDIAAARPFRPLPAEMLHGAALLREAGMMALPVPADGLDTRVTDQRPAIIVRLCMTRSNARSAGQTRTTWRPECSQGGLPGSHLLAPAGELAHGCLF